MIGRNGVDMERVNALKKVMQEDPAAGSKTISAITSWNGGAHSTTIVRNFAVPADEPVVLGGTDRGPGPTELMLTGLSACIAIGIAYSATEDGIEVDSIEIDVAGDLDLGGFLNIGDLRPGLAEIRLTVRVDADAPRETIEELVNHGYRRSPVAASLEGRVPVRICIGGEEAALSEPRSGA